MDVAQTLSMLLYLYALVVIVILIYEERDPSTTLAWTLALILFPVAGLVFYLLFGRNWRTIGTRDKVRAEAERRGSEVMAPHYRRWHDRVHAELSQRPPFLARIAHAIEAQNDTRPLPAVDVEVFHSGAEKFARLIADIEAAQSSVHLQYFIWEHDELTGRICALLAEKARSGVEVRVMYDWVGSLPYKKQQLREVERAGGSVHPDAAHWSKLNYRNHHKIAVIDGKVAYTGGMNMGQEYIDGLPRYASWRDTHVRFCGPLVAELQRMFAERWYRVAKEDLFSARYFPELHADSGQYVWAQLAHSGPESRWEALRNTFLIAISSAEKNVRVQSPYFVPDDSILQALVTQSLSGVDVQFMMTGVPDKKIAWNAAFSYIDELILAGGRLLQYDAGFFHPKMMTIDGELCVIGTTNFDIRSFMLHDELSIFFYDDALAAVEEAAFAVDRDRCREISMATYANFTYVGRFGNAVARLWSRLL
jgi:cardiolipin synthase A/B